MSDSLAPGFLIAVPQLQDPNFRQTVVLLLERNDDGALGIVINQESDLLTSASFARITTSRYDGDPRQARAPRRTGLNPSKGLVLFGAEELNDPEARKSVADRGCGSAPRAKLSTRLCGRGDQHRYHCYSGYAGWGPEQLEREIQETVPGSSAPVDPDADPRRSRLEHVWERGDARATESILRCRDRRRRRRRSLTATPQAGPGGATTAETVSCSCQLRWGGRSSIT